MSLDFQYRGTIGGVSPETEQFLVASGTTASISQGQIFQVTAGFAVAIANGGATAAGKYAYALTTSTETSGAAGVVIGQYCPGGLELIGVASVPGSLAQANMDKGTTLVVAASHQKIDQSNGGSGVITMRSFDNTTNGNVVVNVPWAV